MTIQYTSPFNLPYPQGSDPLKDVHTHIELIAKGVNAALVNGSFPASSPDVASITARLNAVESRKMVFKNAATVGWNAGLVISDAGTLVLDNDVAVASQVSSPTPGFCVPGSVTGSLKFTEPGTYTVQWMTAPNLNPGAQGIRIEMYGTWPGSPSSVVHRIFGQGLKHDTTIYWENVVTSREIRVPTANLEIRFLGQQVNATNVASEIYVTKIGPV